MVKPVCGICNLDCCYCYYVNKPLELYGRSSGLLMGGEVLESFTQQYMRVQPVRTDFNWQGGEPLLAGKDFFRSAIKLQEGFRIDGQVVSNALQTNGTLIDDEWCEIFAQNNFLIGLSLDGPPQWHDRFRKDRVGGPTFHKAWAGLELLRKHNVEFNVLVTLNSVNAPHAGDIYRYFVNAGIRYLQFIPVLERNADGSPTEHSCTAEQFSRFMLDVFATWSSRDIGKVSERFIDGILHQLIFNQPSMCCYSPQCANAHVLEWNGDLYVCDHFVFKQWKIGNIMHTPLKELLQSEMIKIFSAYKAQLPSACQTCQYVQFCNGGCPKHHWPMGTDPTRRNHFCDGYKKFFAEALDDLRDMAVYFAKQQTPPLRNAKEPAREPAIGSRQATGRNDPCLCGSGRKFKNCCGRSN